MKAPCKRSVSIWAIALVAVAFGLLTIREGGAILSGNPAALAAAGDYVPFVVWFNFLAGFAYVTAGIGLWMKRRWASRLALAIFAATALVFAAFGAHVFLGGSFEIRTAFAMALRTAIWGVITLVAWRKLSGGSAGTSAATV